MDSPGNSSCHWVRSVWIAMTGSMVVMAALSFCQEGLALPPPDDIPEEIMRTEIILEARSPVDGDTLSASEYVELQEDLAEADDPPTIRSDIQNLIFLIQIRRAINIVSPVQLF